MKLKLGIILWLYIFFIEGTRANCPGLENKNVIADLKNLSSFKNDPYIDQDLTDFRTLGKLTASIELAFSVFAKCQESSNLILLADLEDVAYIMNFYKLELGKNLINNRAVYLIIGNSNLNENEYLQILFEKNKASFVSYFSSIFNVDINVADSIEIIAEKLSSKLKNIKNSTIYQLLMNTELVIGPNYQYRGLKFSDNKKYFTDKEYESLKALVVNKLPPPKYYLYAPIQGQDGYGYITTYDEITNSTSSQIILPWGISANEASNEYNLFLSLSYHDFFEKQNAGNLIEVFIHLLNLNDSTMAHNLKTLLAPGSPLAIFAFLDSDNDIQYAAQASTLLGRDSSLPVLIIPSPRTKDEMPENQNDEIISVPTENGTIRSNNSTWLPELDRYQYELLLKILSKKNSPIETVIYMNNEFPLNANFKQLKLKSLPLDLLGDRFYLNGQSIRDHLKHLITPKLAFANGVCSTINTFGSGTVQACKPLLVKGKDETFTIDKPKVNLVSFGDLLEMYLNKTDHPLIIAETPNAPALEDVFFNYKPYSLNVNVPVGFFQDHALFSLLAPEAKELMIAILGLNRTSFFTLFLNKPEVVNAEKEALYRVLANLLLITRKRGQELKLAFLNETKFDGILDSPYIQNSFFESILTKARDQGGMPKVLATLSEILYFISNESKWKNVIGANNNSTIGDDHTGGTITIKGMENIKLRLEEIFKGLCTITLNPIQVLGDS